LIKKNTWHDDDMKKNVKNIIDSNENYYVQEQTKKSCC